MKANQTLSVSIQTVHPKKCTLLDVSEHIVSEDQVMVSKNALHLLKLSQQQYLHRQTFEVLCKYKLSHIHRPKRLCWLVLIRVSKALQRYQILWN